MKQSKPETPDEPVTQPIECLSGFGLSKPLLWGKHCRGPGCDDYNEQRPSCICGCEACKPPAGGYPEMRHLRELYAVASGAALRTATTRETECAEAMCSLWIALPGLFTQVQLLRNRIDQLEAEQKDRAP